MQDFADDVGHWPTLFDDDALTAALFGLRAFIEKAGTGGGSFVRCRHTVARTSPISSDDAATAEAAAAADISKAWSTLAAATTDARHIAAGRSLAAAKVAATIPDAETRSSKPSRAASRSSWHCRYRHRSSSEGYL